MCLNLDKTQDCRQCRNCLDQKRYGGLGKLKMACIKKQCIFFGRITEPNFIQAKNEEDVKKLEQQKAQNELKEKFSIEAKTGFWRCLEKLKSSKRNDCAVCPIAKEGVLAVKEGFLNNEGTEYMINGQYSCRSQGVIYLITCSECRIQYVGQVILFSIFFFAGQIVAFQRLLVPDLIW